MAWPPPCPGKGGTQTARSSYARWAAVVALRAWIALTELTNALETTRLPTVPSTTPRDRPLRFFPSRTTTWSISVVPSGRRWNVEV